MGLIGAPTYPMLRDAIQAALFEILDQNRIPYDFNKAENQVVFQETRSKILFRSLDDFERLRGSNLAWFGVDELTYTAPEAWLRLEGRLRDPKARRLCGFGVWTPKGFDWVWERFIESPVTGYKVILAKPYENHYLLEKVPDYYERLKSSYDERFFQQEALGEYLHLHSGLVYHQFDRKRNVGAIDLDPQSSVLWALDFNVDPMSSLVAQVSGDRVVVLDEIVLSRATTWEACEEFHARFPHPKGGVVVYADATGGRLQTTGTSDLKVITQFFASFDYRKVEYKIPKVNPAVRERVTVTNAKLRTADGETHLVVNPKCKELIRDFEQVSFKENSSTIDKERDPKRTHLSDALGYLIWQESREAPKIGWQGTRLV